MTDIATVPSGPLDQGYQHLSEPAPVPVTAPALPLITEQQVLFGSAALVPERLTATQRMSHAAHVVAHPIWSLLARPHRRDEAPRHYASRCSYLEDAMMSREMGRL
jgi:hypothetical protein